MKLFLGICNSQTIIPDEFFWSFINIDCPYEVRAYRSKHPWDIIRNNRIIENFLKSDCDILVKMDLDQSYPSSFFTRLIPMVERFKVIGPLIYDRHSENGNFPLMFNYYEQRDSQFMFDVFDFSEKTGVVEVPYAHTNLCYHRNVLEKLEKPWYEAYATKDGLNRKNHVDFDFLDKIKALGYSIYIDLDTVVGHLKPPEYAR